jgi:hypothetical protein
LSDPYLAWCVDEMAFVVGLHPEPVKEETKLKASG